jgi:hypothetical protein
LTEPSALYVPMTSAGIGNIHVFGPKFVLLMQYTPSGINMDVLIFVFTIL